MLAGIREILIITTPQDQAHFQTLLGDLSYAMQETPLALAALSSPDATSSEASASRRHRHSRQTTQQQYSCSSTHPRRQLARSEVNHVQCRAEPHGIGCHASRSRRFDPAAISGTGRESPLEGFARHAISVAVTSPDKGWRPKLMLTVWGREWR